MTPLAGFVAAIIAGWIIRDPRRAAAAVIVPFAAVLAAQTWILPLRGPARRAGGRRVRSRLPRCPGSPDQRAQARSGRRG